MIYLKTSSVEEMKNIIKSTVTLIIALVGVVGGAVWAITSNWEIEPIILTIVSCLEILGFFLLKSPENSPDRAEQVVTNDNFVNVNVNVNNTPKEESTPEISERQLGRETIIDSMKSKARILFIDDDKNFNVVKILKDSGWRQTKTLVDIKTLDTAAVTEADILFVDINGVGKLLNLQYEGLDLALMLKQKYPSKRVVIYSANKTSNSFHEAWDKCDFKLEKNALPYQFQSLVEEFSVELYKSRL